MGRRGDHQLGLQASFEFSFDVGATGDSDLTGGGYSGAFTITHVGCDPIDTSNLVARTNTGGTADESALGWSHDVSAGTIATVTINAEATVRLDGGPINHGLAVERL